MKKQIIIVLTILIQLSPDAIACDVCGCGVSNYHYGILPQFHQNFVGMRYRYRSYVSTLDNTHLASNSYESFQTTEVWARLYPTKRLQAFLFVPYNFNERKEGEQLTRLNGIGDMVVAVNYTFLNTYDSSAKVKHTLLAGAGVKLPTGKFRELENGLTVNQNFQLGTGSLDLLLNLMYTVRYRSVGLNAEFAYSHNTTNPDEYRFGNTTRSTLTAFLIKGIGVATIVPNLGASLETFEDNRQFSHTFSDTGGWAALSNAGVETYISNFAFGLSYSHPAKQALFEGKVKSQDRISMHFTFMF